MKLSIKTILYINYDMTFIKIVIYIDHAIILGIVKQFTLTTSIINKLNFRFVRTSKFFNRFNFDIRHKPNKKHVIFDALSRLISVNFETHFKFDDKLNVLYVYHVTATVINLSDEFRNKIFDDYRKNKN